MSSQDLQSNKEEQGSPETLPQKILQQQLARSEQTVQVLLNASTDAAFLMDLDGTVLQCNEVTAARVGVPYETLLGQNIYRLIPDEVAELRKAMVDKVVSAGKLVRFEYKRDGHTMDSMIVPVFNEAGEVDIVAITERDITDLRKKELQIEESRRNLTIRNRLAEILLTDESSSMYSEVLAIVLEDIGGASGYIGYIDDNGSLVSPLTFDDNGRNTLNRHSSVQAVLANNEWKGLWGVSLVKKEPLILNTLCEAIPGKRTTQKRALVCPILNENEVIGLFVLADNKEDYSEKSLLRLEEICALIGPCLFNRLTRDREERKRLQVEQELRRARKMESIGTLTGGIAHDFNNLLYVVLGNVEFSLEKFDQGDPIYQNLERIRAAALKGATIVEQLLKFSHGNDDNPMQPTRCKSVIVDTVKLLRSSTPANIRITLTLPENEIVILGNPIQLGQAILNMGMNAVQAMEVAGGELEIILKTISMTSSLSEKYPNLPNGEYALLSVRDCGPGIPAEHLDKVFDPYFTTRNVGEGAGMGLSAVHGIVADHKGGIAVESSPGKGAEFTTLIPLADASLQSFKKSGRELREESKKQIIFVDDEVLIGKIIGKTIHQLGYAATICVDPKEALQLFKDDPYRYDLLITDMTMPEMNGIMLSKNFKAIRNDIPVVICTGYSSLIDKPKAESFGLDGFMKKPVLRDQIAEVIESVLNKQKK